ncbi:hypothetical protein KC19_2G066600 [Ceratodon purpureus]|uniref:Protein kinase domain-containing protein n=1 Tax=Ceratodon purpureus TaxID=3225 RepID=A0A8T0IQW3_CERPU|nr:hypothetical protein KC19_2G066600 [Ceratodon purpureus]KAG0586130.1 hypothetical protein KC19_2G066600 [Ceratodon purpureus]
MGNRVCSCSIKIGVAAAVIIIPLVYRKMSMWSDNCVCSMRPNKCVRGICGRCKRSCNECLCAHLGSCSCPPNAAPLPTCVFYSRSNKMLYKNIWPEFTDTSDTHEHMRPENENIMGARWTYSAMEWTEVDFQVSTQIQRIGEENRRYLDEVLLKHATEWGPGESASGESASVEENDLTAEEHANSKYFDEVLVRHKEWGDFFSKFEDLEVGEKIAEGGQAEIFTATSKSHKLTNLVAKVFKQGQSLKVLEQQWPPGMLSIVASRYAWPFKNLLGGAFLRDSNRFVFVMKRRWGDLRRLIDMRIETRLQNKQHGPPFNDYGIVHSYLWSIAINLKEMHDAGVLHRDLKASNTLLSSEVNGFLEVNDFECSVGVLGTRFYRAPEILMQIQSRLPSEKVVFTKEADIYNFGMLCYEIITGCLPFENMSRTDYSIVIRGERPRLPDDIDPLLRELVLDCWKGDPQNRPSATEVLDRIAQMGVPV